MIRLFILQQLFNAETITNIFMFVYQVHTHDQADLREHKNIKVYEHLGFKELKKITRTIAPCVFGSTLNNPGGAGPPCSPLTIISLHFHQKVNQILLSYSMFTCSET